MGPINLPQAACKLCGGEHLGKLGYAHQKWCKPIELLIRLNLLMAVRVFTRSPDGGNGHRYFEELRALVD